MNTMYFSTRATRRRERIKRVILALALVFTAAAYVIAISLIFA